MASDENHDRDGEEPVCFHFARTFSEDRVPELLRTIASDIEELGQIELLDVTVKIIPALDEVTVSVYYGR